MAAKTIGLIGGTGPEGRGLAARWARAGLDVVIGSRAAERGDAAGREVSELSGGRVTGGTNADAARAGEVVVVTLQYEGLRETLSALRDEIANKIVVSTVVPLRFSRARIAMVEIEAGSAAVEAQQTLPDARVVGALHNISSSHLLHLDEAVAGDVIVCGDDRDAILEVIALAELIKDLRGVEGGPLANSRYVEGLTALILNINRIHKTEAAVKLVGL
jgi:NADPH-dependent F420 reductase